MLLSQFHILAARYGEERQCWQAQGPDARRSPVTVKCAVFGTTTALRRGADGRAALNMSAIEFLVDRAQLLLLELPDAGPTRTLGRHETQRRT